MTSRRSSIRMLPVFLRLVLVCSGTVTRTAAQAQAPAAIRGRRRRRSSSASRWAPIASSPTGTSCTSTTSCSRSRRTSCGSSSSARRSEGRPYIALFISSPANLAKLDHYKQMNARLADPRGLSEADAKKLVADAQGGHHPVVRAALERSGGGADGRGVRLRQPHAHRRRSAARSSTT